MLNRNTIHFPYLEFSKLFDGWSKAKILTLPCCVSKSRETLNKYIKPGTVKGGKVLILHLRHEEASSYTMILR